MAGIEYQISIFEMIEKRAEPDIMDRCLMEGSGYSNGRLRIFAAAVSMTNKELAVYLKNEYGVGGFSNSKLEGFVDYSGNGIMYRKRRSNESIFCKWPEAAKRIKRLIATDSYLYPAERKQLDKIRASFGGQLPLPMPRMQYPPEIEEDEEEEGVMVL